MPATVTEHPVVAAFELLLLTVFLWALYRGVREEWNHRVLGRPRPSLGRGEGSWRDLSLAWVVVMGYAATLVSLADLPRSTDTLLHTWNALTVFYLVFLNWPGRNRVVRFASYVRNLEK